MEDVTAFIRKEVAITDENLTTVEDTLKEYGVRTIDDLIDINFESDLKGMFTVVEARRLNRKVVQQGTFNHLLPPLCLIKVINMVNINLK